MRILLICLCFLAPFLSRAQQQAGPEAEQFFSMAMSQINSKHVGWMLQTGMTVWIYYPKGSSKIQTDLTRDKGWDCLKAEEDKLTWLNLISLNETWSAFGFRVKTEADKKKESKPAVEREIFKWANSATKEIILPPDLATAFKKHKKEAAYFHSLAFSHKREYVEWIVTAKKEETRAKRIEGTIERLMLQWKNPRDQ